MNRKLALILSLIYCGLGQIYKGEAWKGINFAIIYSALIMSLIFLSPSPLALLVLIFLLILMWLTGIVDACADDKIFIEGEHGLFWKTLIMVLIVIGVVGSIVAVTLLIVRPQVFAYDTAITGTVSTSQPNKTIELLKPKIAGTLKLGSDLQKAQTHLPRPQTNESKQEKPVQSSGQVEISNSEKIENDVETKNTGYYTVQVGAFSEGNRADELAKQLKEKGYTVRVVSPLSDESSTLYKVQVGKYDNKDSAAKSAKKLNKYEGVNDVVILPIHLGK